MSRARLILPAITVGLGVAMIALAVIRGGGPLATGVLVGTLFVVAGAGRFWLERQR